MITELLKILENHTTTFIGIAILILLIVVFVLINKFANNILFYKVLLKEKIENCFRPAGRLSLPLL